MKKQYKVTYQVGGNTDSIFVFAQAEWQARHKFNLLTEKGLISKVEEVETA